MVERTHNKGEGVFWVKMPVSLLQDKQLSMEARGLLACLLSYPKDWIIRTHVIEKETGWSPVKRRKVFAECEQAGYLTGAITRDGSKRTQTDWKVYEHPQPELERSNIFNTSNLKTSKMNALKMNAFKTDHPTIENQETLDNQETIDTKKEHSASFENPPLVSIHPDSANTSASEPNGNQAVKTPNNVPPAVELVRQIIGRYPNKGVWKAIERVLAVEPDVARLRGCYVRWVALGWNPMNLAGWLFDWYANKTAPFDLKEQQVALAPGEVRSIKMQPNDTY